MTDRLESRLDALRAADAEWGAAHLDPAEEQRIRARLDAPAPRRWRPTAALATAAVVATAAFVLWPAAVPPCPPGPAADACVIHHDASAIHVQAGGDVLTGADGVEVRAGRVRFAVETRAGQTYAVMAAGARIEVLGTTFDVAVLDDAGRVDLVEGRIRLTTPDGRMRALIPGESATWSATRARTAVPVTAPTPVTPTAPTPSTDAPRSGSPSAIEPAPARPRPARPERPAAPPPRPPVRSEPSPYALARVQALRDAGDAAGAIAQIDALLRRFPRASTAEALSLERIDLLDHALLDRERACHHLDLHLRRFADSPLAPTARATARRLRCSDGPDDAETP